MDQDDIRLTLNGTLVSQFHTLGESIDVSFFEEHRDHFNGRHTFEFHVGDNRVRNNVEMRPFEISIKNDFVPFDIKSFVNEEKARVHAEMEAAGFHDRPSDVAFIAGETLLACDRLPEFDHAKLSVAPDGKKFFVSHRWMNPAHPDPNGKHLALLKEHTRHQPGGHYWIDFCCLPQPRLASDTKVFEKSFPKLTGIQADASTLIILDEEYSERLWCYVEHYFGVLFSQASFAGRQRTLDYLGERSADARRLVDDVQSLREPDWDRLRVTKASDVPFIKLNFRFLTNVVKFQLVDRFAELFTSLPSRDLYCGASRPYPQCAFGLSYSESLNRIRSIYGLFGWRMAELYEKNSLTRTAALLARSQAVDDYPMDGLRFSKYLFYSAESVAYLAMLIAVIRQANRSNENVRYLRTLYAKLVMMSMFR